MGVGDLPPRPECAPLWHPQLRPQLPQLRLTLLVGSYAQAYYLGKRGKKTLGDTVLAWQEICRNSSRCRAPARATSAG